MAEVTFNISDKLKATLEKSAEELNISLEELITQIIEYYVYDDGKRLQELAQLIKRNRSS